MNNSNELNDIIKRMKRQRELLNLSYQELSERTGISKSTLQRYETGAIKNIKISKFHSIANALNATTEYLLGLEESNNFFENDTTEAKNVNSTIKVYGKICAGNGKIAYEDYIDEIFCPYPRAKGNMIALQVDGESMNKIVPNGVYSIIKLQPTVENGQVCAVIINNENAMLKRFYRLDDETVVLKPESSENFKPITFMGDEMNRIKVIGKYIGYVTPYAD